MPSQVASPHGDGGSSEALEARPIAWSVLLVLAAAHVLLHLVTNGRFGLFRDEYYYLACAERPAWGYVDHPPLSIWILAGWEALFGDSLHSIRILPAVLGSATIVTAGATAAELGGGRWAQLFAGLGVLIGGVFLVITGYYSMNAFDFLFWIGAYWVLIRALRAGDGRWWVPLGFVLGLGLLNKVGLLVFGLALLLGLLATRHRRHLARRPIYVGGAIAVGFLLPYIAWNAAHDWVALEFIANAKSGKIAAFSPPEFLAESILEANPLTLPLWAGGLAWLLLARRARPVAVIGWMCVLTFAILVAQRSKPYYFATTYPVLLAAGGVAWERWTSGRRWTWARGVLAALLVAGGAILAPMAVPMTSPERTLAYGQRLGIVPAPQEVSHTSALPQYFSDRLGWENLARVVSEAYLALPPEERERCIVFGQNYGHAGAIEYWARKYPLPPAYAPHNNYWLWGPPPADTGRVIVIRGNPDRLREVFEDVAQAAVASTPGAIEDSMTIWLCSGLRRPIAEVWSEAKYFR